MRGCLLDHAGVRRCVTGPGADMDANVRRKLQFRRRDTCTCWDVLVFVLVLISKF